MIDLEKLKTKIDEVLESSSSESLTKWLEEKRGVKLSLQEEKPTVKSVEELELNHWYFDTRTNEVYVANEMACHISRIDKGKLIKIKNQKLLQQHKESEAIKFPSEEDSQKYVEQYAIEKSSADVFRKAHIEDYKNGFAKAISEIKKLNRLK